MNENSPICARLAEIVSAVMRGCPNSRTMKNAAMDFPRTMMNTVASSGNGSRYAIIGSTSMPTETKNSTANASRSGSVSCAARWLSSDSLRIMPAKNAPSANDTSNSIAAPNATPSEMASTASRNSSREPVCAT